MTKLFYGTSPPRLAMVVLFNLQHRLLGINYCVRNIGLPHSQIPFGGEMRNANAIWAGFLGAVLVAVALVKIWDVAWVVDEGLIYFTQDSEVVDPATSAVTKSVDYICPEDMNNCIVSITASGDVPINVIEVDQDTTQHLGGITMTKENTYVCPNGSFVIADDPMSISKVCRNRFVDKAEMLLGVDMGTMDYTPIQVNKEGYVKAAGRVKDFPPGHYPKEWVPIAVDKEGRVIPSIQPLIKMGKEGSMFVLGGVGADGDMRMFKTDNQGRVICSPQRMIESSGFIGRACVGLGKEGASFPCWIDRCQEPRLKASGLYCIDEHGGIHSNK